MSFGSTWSMVPGGCRPPLSSCGCNDFPAQPCGPFFPHQQCNSGCPILLDSGCVIYHKNGNSQSRLINLNLPNGSTAELIFDTIDNQLGFINVNNWALPTLRSLFTITNLQQFGQAVDATFSIIDTEIANLSGSTISLSTTPTPSITFTLTGTLNRNISANSNISASPNNLISINSDGLYVVPQNLSINAGAKTLSISDGNTVNLSSLVCGVGGFLGNVTADPNPVIDGQYWFRTDLLPANGLRISLNGSIRTIPTS